MVDNNSDTVANTPEQNQDPSFVYGDAPGRKKIDAWEGEGDADLLSDAGEMSLANLHFGSTPEAELLLTSPVHTETASSGLVDQKSATSSAISVEIPENQDGAIIGSLAFESAGESNQTTFTVSDDRFVVVDGNLRLADGVSLDFEEIESVSVTVTATDGDGGSVAQVFDIEVIDINDPPQDLTLDGNTVAENDAGAVIGTLSSFDPDAGDSVTYTVSDPRFEVVDGELRLVDGVSLDHEEAASVEVTVTATDSGGLSTEETFTIDVVDVNEVPSDLQLDGSAVAENDAGAVIGTLSSFDPDAGDSISYTVSDPRFEVVDGELCLVDGVSLDHEEAASIEVTITATDTGGLSTAETFTIDVTDVNETPSDLSLDGNTVSENDAGAVVGTLSSFDPDAGDSVTYTVSDPRFEVVDGELRLVDGVSLDQEEASSVEVTVTATDSSGLSTEETFRIDVVDVNETPSDLALDGNSISENDAGAAVGTLSSFDPDAGDSITYTVSDPRFEVVDGELRLVDGASLDHEEAASVEVTVTATDSGGLSTEETFTIDVTDVNEVPSDLTLDGSTVAENDAGAVIGTLSSFDPDAGDSISYTVSDARFEVVDGELRLVDGVSLDHEEAASIEVTITATDSGGLSTEETFTIDVTDVNEGPSDLALDGSTVAENHAGAVVGTLSSFDPDAADSVTYTVSDPRFEVVDGELRLVDGVSLDHEEAASIEVTVTAADSGGLSTEETFAIEVSDVNETPSDLALDGNSVSENDAGAVVGTLSSFDPDAGDSITYTVSDPRFEVVDGELRLVDGESLDHEDAASVEVTVTATDAGGLSTEETFTIDVTDVNEVPSDLALDGNTVSENDAGAVVGTLSSFDPDAGDSITYTVSDPRFEVVDGELRLVDGVSLDHEEAALVEVTVTATDSGGLSTEEIFTIDVVDVNETPSELALDGNSVSGNDAGAVVGTLSSFDPDAGDSITYTVSDPRFEVVDGELRLVDGVSLDHEDAASIEVTVTATDTGGLSTEETFTIDVTDVNETPSDLQLDGNTVSENDAGAVVGTLSSFDPDAGDSVTYSVSDPRFEVVDGELRLVDGVSLDHEEAASIEVTITATDGGGLSTEEIFTIDVVDVNETPSDLALDGNSVSENDAGAAVGTLSSFDPDAGDSITYTVSDPRFEVVDGELRLVDGVSLDHEEAASVEVTVTATDTGGLSTEESFTIDVADVNEGPSDLQLDGNSVSENDAGATVGTLSSFDPDAGDSVTYSVSDPRFEVVDGELRLVDGVSLDHEEAASIEVTVTATDSGGLSTEETFTIDVVDVNETPSDLALDGNSVSENDAGAVIGTLSSFDPDAGDSISYTVSDPRFEVVDGELRLVDGVSLDHEEAASIEVTVTATDSGGLSTEETFTIDVVDVNETPSDLALDGNTVSENDAGAVVGTLSSFDPDAGDSITYAVSDARFEVVDGELRLVDGVSLDHEEAASIDVTITATDSGGLSSEETFTIDVVDVNEVPSDLQLDGSAVAENDAGAVIGTLSSFDPDAGDSISYTVSDPRFEVVDGELRLVDGVSLDHEEVESIDLTVTATDGEGLSTEETFTIHVADVNETPFDLSLTRETGLAEADFSANDGHSGASVQQLGLETDAIVFTMSFTTSGDVDTTQTLFETGGSVYGTNVVIEDGMLLIYAGEGNDLELSVPINGDTEYSLALELDTDSNRIRVLLSDELPLDQMNADNSLVASLENWTDRDYTGSNHMGVGQVGGGSSQGNIGGDFLGEIDAPGLQVFSDSHLEDVLTEVGVEENTEGAVVGTLSVSDPDAGDTVTYTVSDPRFEVVDGELRLVDGVTLDFEDASTIDVTVTATDSGGLSTSETFTVDVVDLNEAPYDLNLDHSTIDENTTEGVVGTVTVSDPDAGDTHTFRLVDNDDAPFTIDEQTGEISLVTPGIPETSVLRIDASETDSLTQEDGISAVRDLSSEGNTIRQTDADERPELTNDGPFGGPGLQFDGVNDRLDISDDSTLNLSSQSERSFAMTIRTGEDVDSRQIIFEEGGTVNGFNFYIDDGQLYMGAWSDSNGWSFEAIAIDVEPDQSYSIVTVFDGASNTYTAYVNGENVGSVEVGDSMSAHSGNIGLGGIAQHTVFHDGASSANDGYYFDGSIGEFAIFNDALSNAEVTGIDMDFRGISADIDFETRDSYDLTVEVTDAAGESYLETFTIDVNDVNEVPTDLSLDGNTVSENDAGAVVGTLSSFDPDAGDSVTYTVSDARFEVVDGELRLVDGVSLDHEDAASVDVTVTATDSGGLSTEETFTIDVLDVNETPSDLQLDGNSVSENDAGAVVGTLSSFDPDAGDSITYTVSDPRFDVVDGELRLVDGVSLDHEEAASVEVTVTATDSGGLSTEETFTIDVTDVNEGPSDLALDGRTVAENDAGAVIGTLSSFDPDAGDSVTYSVSDPRFEVVDGELRLVDGVSLDHEEAASVEVTVNATDSGGLSTEATFAIEVSDVNETPSDLALDGNSVSENDSGAVVGTLSSFDPDAGDSITYAVSDARFEVVDGELRLVDGVSLDHEEAASIEVEVTATDNSGLATTETFTIDVVDQNEAPSGLVLTPNTGNLITGGSFEGQDVNTGGWRGFGADPTGTWDSANGIEVWDNLGGIAASEGNQFLELDYTNAADAISQTVATESGQTYTLSFDVRARGATTTDTIEVYWNGELVDIVDPSSTDWETATFNVVGTGGNDVLEFREADGESDSLGAHLDNVSLVAVPMTLLENEEGASLGMVSAFDPDAGDILTFSVSDDRFEVVGGELRLKAGISLDHEEAASLDITVTATDAAGLSTSESFTIDVLDVDEAPEGLTLTPVSAVTTEAATVADGDIRLTNGGGEASSVVTLGDAVAGTSEVVIDFARIDNSLQIEVNGQAISDEIMQLQSNVFDDASQVMLVFEDGSTATTPWVTNSDGSPRFRVVISDDGVEIYGTRTPGSSEMELMTLEGGDFNLIDLLVGDNNVTVINPDDSGPDGLEAIVSGQFDTLVEGLSVAENDAGATIATVSAADPDAGDSVTYSVSDARFEVVDGELRLVDGVSLDYETEQSVELEVTATDSTGLETTETFSIEVRDVAETIELADGGETYAEIGKAELTVMGGNGDDTMIGGSGDDQMSGGAGDDLFIYGENGGSDSFDGGLGWTDAIDLSGALGEDAVYGQDWTVTVTEGEIVSEDENSIELTDDAAGFITLENGDTIDFSNIEQIGF